MTKAQAKTKLKKLKRLHGGRTSAAGRFLSMEDPMLLGYSIVLGGRGRRFDVVPVPRRFGMSTTFTEH